MFAFHALAYPMNFGHIIQQVRGQPVDAAREYFADTAISYGCKYIFFWDEDVAPPPQAVPELIYKMEHHPEIAVCGGVYCLKREPPEPLVFMGNGNGCCWDWKAGEFFEVSGCGMGCTVVRVDVFKDLKKPWFKTEFNYEKMMDGQGGLESWSEDLWFCDRVNKTKKWKVYVDGSIICGHYDMDTSKRYDLPADCKPVQRMRASPGKKILDIGSGFNPYQTDEGKPIKAESDERTMPDYRCDLRKLPFATKEFDIVFSPALERFPINETEEVLIEWRRVMKDAGEMRLVVSDIAWIAKEIMQGRLSPEALNSMKRARVFTYDSLVKCFPEMKIEKVPSDPAHIAIRIKT
jgi:predicted SAM-dependent methyltransferase